MIEVFRLGKTRSDRRLVIEGLAGEITINISCAPEKSALTEAAGG
jgi:hypothetical protein